VNTLKGVNATDILISNEWPAGVERNSATAPGSRMGGSKPVAELAHQLRPRYHFVPGGEKHWEREPYRNEIRKGESGDRISRFYALGDWGNAGKQKAIFAFSLNITEPTTAAATSTASPYADARGTKRLAEENPNGTFFWGDHTSQHHHKRRGGGRGHQPRPPPGPDSCFFCLSYPQLEKHLIVSIGSESYLTTAKGPLTSAATNPEKLPFSGHILIIPFSHTPTLPLIEDEETRKSTLGEMRRYKLAIEKMLSTRGCGAVTFEIRRRNGVHAHWQFVPVATELLASVDAAFEAAAGEGLGRGFEDEEESEEPGDAFTYWISGAERGRELKLEANEYFDLQFGRRVLAGVLGTGRERGNWRDCVLGVEEESNDAKMFKEAFAEFDFSLEE